MKAAIMQPYFFPYLGYFQLIDSVDLFVVLDDVHYINRGWINRNRIWLNDSPKWLTVPLRKASQNRLIREIQIQDRDTWRDKALRTLSQAYSRAPFRKQAVELFSEATQGDEENLSCFLVGCIRQIMDALSISTEIIPSSSAFPKGGLRGQDRILEICRSLEISTYMNPPGGTELYDEKRFEEAGIELVFQQPDLRPSGIGTSSEEGAILSVLDLFFLNSAESIAASLPSRTPS